MSKHAPLPWTFTANSWQYTTVYDADNLPVCELDLENWPVTEENQDAFEKEQAKLAAFIVKAVNSHDELKACVAELVGIYWGDGDGIEPPPHCIIRALKLLNEVQS